MFVLLDSEREDKKLKDRKVAAIPGLQSALNFFKHKILISYWHSQSVTSVGIAIRYGLDGPGIESRWWRDFPHQSRPALGPTQPPAKWVLGLFSRVRLPGRGFGHPPSSRAEVKRNSRSIPLLPIWAFMACFRVNFTFYPSVAFPDVYTSPHFQKIMNGELEKKRLWPIKVTWQCLRRGSNWIRYELSQPHLSFRLLSSLLWHAAKQV
jgi:hypothetical protein